MTPHVEKWTRYNAERRAPYEYRAATRFRAVTDRLFALGLSDEHSVIDVGAGHCQFGRYLSERGFKGQYRPWDAVLQGIDLEDWMPEPGDFMVCMEVLEHLFNWPVLLRRMVMLASRAVIVTTPNPEEVDVLKCDPTHVSIIHPGHLAGRGFTVERHSFFWKRNTEGQLDTLLAWRTS